MYADYVYMPRSGIYSHGCTAVTVFSLIWGGEGGSYQQQGWADKDKYSTLTLLAIIAMFWQPNESPWAHID